MKKNILAFSCFCALFSTNTEAQVYDPLPVELLGLTFIPELSTNFRQDDNIYLTNKNQVDDLIFQINPSLKLGRETGVDSYGIELEVLSNLYSNETDNNHTNAILRGLIHKEPSNRHRYNLEAGISSINQPFGTGLTQGQELDSNSPQVKPYTYQDQELLANYEYGAESATIRIGGEIQYIATKYQNYKALNSQRYNTDKLKLQGELKYAIGDVTDLNLKLIREKIDYTESADRDSVIWDALIGVKWEPLAKTTGSLHLGYESKEFTHSNRKNFNGLAADVSVTWQPKTYSTFNLIVTRASADSYITTIDYIKRSAATLNWTHDWQSHISSQIELTKSYDNYIANESAVGFEPDNDTFSFYMAGVYEMRRWLKFSVGYQYTNRDSDVTLYNYDQNAITFSATMSL